MPSLFRELWVQERRRATKWGTQRIRGAVRALHGRITTPAPIDMVDYGRPEMEGYCRFGKIEGTVERKEPKYPIDIMQYSR